MKSLNKLAAAVVLSGMGLCAQPMLASAAPQLSIQSERAAHPRIVEAIPARCRTACGNGSGSSTILAATRRPHIADTRKRHLIPWKRALYYRLKMDDAAIDGAQ